MLLKDLKFINYATIQHDTKWKTVADNHAWHEIIAIESGSMSVKIEDKILHGQAGDVFFYRAGTMHQENTNPQHPALTLCLSVAANEELCGNVLTITHDFKGRIRQLLHWVAQEMPMNLFDNPSRIIGILHAIFVELTILAQPQESAFVQQVNTFIHQHLCENITVDQLADDAAMSKYYFIREYHRQTGVTPMIEVRRQRMEQARTLLLSTPWPIRTIAGKVGISNEYYLSTLFRQHFGISPGRLRKKFQC